jgi:hypothetical protein
VRDAVHNNSPAQDPEPKNALTNRALVDAHVQRVEIRSGELAITLTGTAGLSRTITIAWSAPAGRVQREILAPDDLDSDARPMRWQPRARLLEGIAKARMWVDELTSARVRDIAEIAKREKRSERSVRQTITLAFLDPAVVRAAIHGNLPNTFGFCRLAEAPSDWTLQLTGPA